MKTCAACNVEKPKLDFRNKKHTKDGLHPWCILCCREYGRQHYRDNKQKYIDKANQWVKENHSRRLEIQASHKKNNRAAATADTAMYRAAKDQRTPNWLTEFDYIHIKCLYQVAAMRTRESGEPWHVDHVIPLRGKNVSGLHVPANMQVIRGEDNVRKNNVYEGV